MDELITLTCPSCGGKLQVGKNTLVLKCQHCGIEHLVHRSGDVISLESFARCPKCGRNDRVEKVTSVIRSQSSVSSLIHSLSPPKKPNIKYPRVIPLEKRNLVFIFGTILIIPFGFLFFSCLFCGVLFDIDREETFLFSSELGTLIILSLPMIIGIILIIIYFAGREKTKEINDKIMKQNVIEKESCEKENQRLQREWQLALDIWEKLYYCYRDDVIFLPDKADYGTADKMNEFIDILMPKHDR